MASPRAELVAILRAGLAAGAYSVLDFNAELGDIKRRTVTVQTTALAAPLTFRVWQATAVVDVVAPQRKYEDAERALEASLADVLGVLRDAKLADLMAGAERIVRNERHQAWRITLTLPLKED